MIGRFVDSPSVLYRRKHRALYGYWQGKRPAPDRLPARQHIDPAEIPELLGFLWMTDVVHTGEGVRFRERLVGTRMGTLYGRETTGLYFEEIYSGAHLRRQLDTYTAIVEAGRPHLSRLGVPHPKRDFLIYDRLILPLATDGTTVDLLIGIHAYQPDRGEDPSMWPPPDVTYTPDTGDAMPFRP